MPPRRNASMATLTGRTCLITGASSGIGRGTALALAERGANLWLLCRDPERGQATVDEIGSRARGGDVRLLLADLTSQRSIRAAAGELVESGEPLHVLINNAGAVFLERSKTPDGIEATFALNHLAPFLLTNLLLDRLVASGPARVITVSSAGHAQGRIRLDDLESSQSYRGFLQYCNTKLANVLFTYELARRLEGTAVVAHCLHPGAVRTGLGMNNRGIVRALWKLAHPFLRSTSRGAETSVFLASAPEVAELTGKYWANCRERSSSPRSREVALARALWQASERLCGLTPAGRE